MRFKSILLVLGPACGLLLCSSPALATYPLPEPSSGAPPLVRRVEVPPPEPAGDSTDELLRMQVAAAGGALVGGAVTAVWMRRRPAAARPSGGGLIDLDADIRVAP